MLQEEGGGGGWVQMKCENTGSCLKHPLEGGAAEQMGVKELREELFDSNTGTLLLIQYGRLHSKHKIYVISSCVINHV